MKIPVQSTLQEPPEPTWTGWRRTPATASMLSSAPDTAPFHTSLSDTFKPTNKLSPIIATICCFGLRSAVAVEVLVINQSSILESEVIIKEEVSFIYLSCFIYLRFNYLDISFHKRSSFIAISKRKHLDNRKNLICFNFDSFKYTCCKETDQNQNLYRKFGIF